jgi:hypothetical protein
MDRLTHAQETSPDSNSGNNMKIATKKWNQYDACPDKSEYLCNTTFCASQNTSPVFHCNDGSCIDEGLLCEKYADEDCFFLSWGRVVTCLACVVLVALISAPYLDNFFVFKQRKTIEAN